MKLFLSKSHSDEDGPYAEEGKLGIIYSNKEDLNKLCDFFSEVKKYITENDKCHMQFRDNFNSWDKGEHIDIEINMTND